MPLFILLLWVVLLTLELIYSWAFSYRDAGDQPLKFRQCILGLRALEKVIFVVVLIMLLGEKHYSAAALVAGAGLGGPAAVSQRAYRAEVRRRAEIQVKANKMEWSAAMDVARDMLDREIEEGWVFF